MKSTNQKFDYFSRVVWAISLLILSIIFVQTSFAAGAIDPTFNASVTEGDGGVSDTVIQPDGKIIVFGFFQRANNVRQQNIARFNADGTLDMSFNPNGSGANGSVGTVALQPDGKILIGGAFTAYNGQARNRLARLNADGTLDISFNSPVNFNNTIYVIVIQPDGKLLVGGFFNAPNGQPLASRMARLNADGSIDSSFINNVGKNGGVTTIAHLPDGKILVGGNFITVGGVGTGPLARLNADGSLDTSFTPSGSGNEVEKIIALPNGKILVGGSGSGSAIRRLNADGTLDESFDGLPLVITFQVYDLELQADGKIVAGLGYNVTRDFAMIRLNTDLTLDETFVSGISNKASVNGVAVQTDGKIIFGGDFLTYNDEPRLHLARLNSNGVIDNSFNPSISVPGVVRAIKRQADGKILIGGDFEFVNGMRRTNLARLNTDGSLDFDFNLPVDAFDYDFGNYVHDIELQADGKIIVGRARYRFLSVALTESGLDYYSDGAVLRLNVDGSIDESFATILTHRIFSVGVQSDNKLFIGGYYENLTTPPFGTGSIRRLNPNGELDSTFAPQMEPSIESIREILIQADGKTLVGGVFNAAGGFPFAGTARYNADGTFDATYAPNTSNVYALGQAGDGKIYIGGTFAASGNNSNPNFTRLNTNGSFDSGFITGLGANAFVRDLFVQTDGKIIIGGDFTAYNGTTAKGIARVNPNGSLDSSFNAGAGTSGSIHALESQTDGKILVGGSFVDFNGTEKFSLVRLQNPLALNSSPFDFDGDRKTDLSIFRAANGEWWYQRSSDNQVRAAQFGTSTDKIVPADYTGDGKTDIAIWRPATGEWYILRSEDGSYFAFPFGQSGDIPAPGDFDGDGKMDAAVFRPSNATWYILLSSGGTRIVQFGASGDFPTVGDYDGDQVTDIAIFRPSSGQWWLNRSSSGIVAVTFGSASDKPAQGDYTGDGKTDVAFWRPTTGEWFVLRSENGSYFSAPFGATGDFPTVGDYDGDGKFDFAVFRPSIATWYVNRTTSGLLIQQFGLSTDTPVPSAFVP